MTQSHPLDQTDLAILDTLFYFEIFSYPLSVEEVCFFSKIKNLPTEIAASHLEQLASKGFVFKIGYFFSTQNRPEWAVRRLDCNRRADELLPKAYSKALLIAQFPFVRAVMVSGSLSKHCVSKDSDIDFFIVTTPGRLWLTRLLLTFYKKIFLLNSHKYFCINYFVDSKHLEIEEKNIFTAVETATLLPVFSKSVYQQFLAANRLWLQQFLPNFSPRSLEKVPEHSPSPRLKNSLEWLFSGFLGKILDVGAMQLTVFFWKRKFRHLDSNTFELALKSKQHVSKHHPQYFQQRVLDAFQKKWGEFKKKWQFK